MRLSFLNDLELTQSSKRFENVGFFTRHFADEQDFFSWIMAGSGNSLGRPWQLVYTSALNGAGQGRRALVPAFLRPFIDLARRTSVMRAGQQNKKTHSGF
jgi:hypothetical protein